MSAKAKVVSHLSTNSNTLTADTMQALFGIKNPTAVINELRNEGYAIYRNTKKTASGEKVSYYKLGKPTRQIVAAGIRALRKEGISPFA